MVKRSINGQQRMNKRMIPKRFERLEIDTTRLLTAAAQQSDNTQIKNEHSALVIFISLFTCVVFNIIGAVLLCIYGIMFNQEEKGYSTPSQSPQHFLISGCVFMAVACIACIVCSVKVRMDDTASTKTSTP